MIHQCDCLVHYGMNCLFAAFLPAVWILVHCLNAPENHDEAHEHEDFARQPKPQITLHNVFIESTFKSPLKSRSECTGWQF